MTEITPLCRNEFNYGKQSKALGEGETKVFSLRCPVVVVSAMKETETTTFREYCNQHPNFLIYNFQLMCSVTRLMRYWIYRKGWNGTLLQNSIRIRENAAAHCTQPLISIQLVILQKCFTWAGRLFFRSLSHVYELLYVYTFENQDRFTCCLLLWGLKCRMQLCNSEAC